MKRLNPDTRQWERMVDGAWVAVESGAQDDGSNGGTGSESLDAAIADAFGEPSIPAPQATAGAVTSGTVTGGVPAPSPTRAQSARARGVAAVVPDGGHVAGLAAVDGDDDGLVDEIPGLVSGDGARGTQGTKSVRSRLQGLAQKRQGAQGGRQGLKVQVGPKSARAVGPAVKDGTEVRQQTRAKVKAQGGVAAQRYTNRPAPQLLQGRPAWVQDLFEAHFRSELTLSMRKEYGRMKISRQDYAIGWLTLLDKIREDPSIARTRKNGAD